MVESIFDSAALLGPLKINGTCKPGQITDTVTGWFYPLYITRKEAIQADLDNNGKGIYQVITFYDKEGEFYVADSYGKFGEIKDPLIYTPYEGRGADNPFSLIKNKLSILVDTQLPEFIQTDYGMFVTFIKAYYEFLEQNHQAQELLQDVTKYADIDETSEEMIKKFLANYASDLAESKVTDNRFLVKRVKEIYSRKGTESAYRILFNILYKETIDFFYPYDVVLKPSSGKWETPKTLRVKRKDLRQNIFDFKNTEIKGLISNATAVIDNVQKINIGDYDVYDLILDVKSLKGVFIAGEEITAIKSVLLEQVIDKSNLSAILHSILSSVDVIDGKRGYKKGHQLSYITDNEGNGSFAKARVSSVNRFGTIVGIEVENSGVNYSSNTTIIPGLPTEKITGKYTIKNGIVTVDFPNQHNMVKGTLIGVKYTGNTFSRLYNTSHIVKVVSVPNIKSIRYKYPGF